MADSKKDLDVKTTIPVRDATNEQPVTKKAGETSVKAEPQKKITTKPKITEDDVSQVKFLKIKDPIEPIIKKEPLMH